MINVFDLIGLPYQENGRGPEGYDCYGLAIEVEKRFGKKLRDAVYENHNIELSQKWAPLLNVKKLTLLRRAPYLKYMSEIHSI